MAGIDLGTSGVRVSIVSERGGLVASGSAVVHSHRSPDGAIHEQDPRQWWDALCGASQQALGETASAARVCAVGVTSTSGSLVAATAGGVPVRPAILYDDRRAAALGNASFSIAKAAWLRRDEPQVWEQVRFLLHPSDWIAGRLTARFGVSDYSNALKLGFDPEIMSWTGIVDDLRIPRELLPAVVSPGVPMGTVTADAAQQTGLPAGLPVVLAGTDSMADLVASGLKRPGDVNTTLGTTIVWKALTANKPTVAGAGIYSHRHPGGGWAPGAAGNSGPGSLDFGAVAASPREADRKAGECFPTGLICYPLRGSGERYPFHSTEACGFLEGTPAGPCQQYAAQLEALAYIERWGYERLNDCGIDTGGNAYCGGKASGSDVLTRLRATVLRRPIERSLHPNAAFGAAIVAAAGIHGGSVADAISSMTRTHSVSEPCPQWTERYQEGYQRFREACRQRGYGV